MAGKALKNLLLASTLVASVLAIPMTASAESGIASVYNYGGRPTADGERASPSAMNAAHRTLPFGTMVRVTNNGNGTETVTVTDLAPVNSTADDFMRILIEPQ